MSIGKLVKPNEGDRWFSLEPLPHFCNDYRWEKDEDFHYYVDVAEYLWTMENIKKYGLSNAPLLCYLSISCSYDPNEEYPDAQAKEYDRYCIEELGFQYLEFDEDGWPSLNMLCESHRAYYIMERIREKLKELNFPDDSEESWGTGFHRSDQVRCPRCEHICLAGVTYCPECSLKVGMEQVNWSTGKYPETSTTNFKEGKEAFVF